MKKRMILCVLCLALLLPLTTVTAHADCTPKPSLNVKADDYEDIYIAILVPADQNGINSSVEPPDKSHFWNSVSYEAYVAFCTADYGGLPYYFRGNAEVGEISWKYNCPEQFRIAIYCPEYQTLIYSEKVFSTYAFRSDFNLDLTHVDMTTSGMADIRLRHDKDYGALIGGFLLRASLTLLIELAVAFLFGYWEKKYVRYILFVNLVTQVGLNALLSLWYLADGPFQAMLSLVFAEVIVLAVESVLYARSLRGKNRGAVRAVFYAIAANLASVIIGWYLID